MILECPDTYATLVAKTHALTKWARARDYDWMFKCDDDTYVRPRQLLASNFSTADYSGFCDGRWSNGPGPGLIYAYAQGGAGYWLSRRAIAIVADHLLTGEFAEDCAVGKTLGLQGIIPVHDARYVPGYPGPPRNIEIAPPGFLTLHKCDAASIRLLYQRDQAIEAIADRDVPRRAAPAEPELIEPLDDLDDFAAEPAVHMPSFTTIG